MRLQKKNMFPLSLIICVSRNIFPLFTDITSSPRHWFYAFSKANDSFFSTLFGAFPVIECMSVCCLVPSQHAMAWWEQVTFWLSDHDVFFVLDQHAELDFIVMDHGNNCPRANMSLQGAYYPDSEQTNLYSDIKYQIA